MKVFPLLLLTLWGLGAGAAEPEEGRGLDIDAALGLSRITYQETPRLAPLTSDWEATGGWLRLGATLTRWKPQPYLMLELSGTDTEEETWTENGVVVQRNDLQLAQVDMRGGIGLPISLGETTTLRLRVGALYSVQDYERSRFFIRESDGGTRRDLRFVTESVRTAGPQAALRLDLHSGGEWTLSVETEMIWLLLTEADNDGFEVEVDGEGGWRAGGRLALTRQLARPGQEMGLAVLAETQRIDRGYSETPDSLVEWPDNRLERAGIELYWRGSF